MSSPITGRPKSKRTKSSKSFESSAPSEPLPSASAGSRPTSLRPEASTSLDPTSAACNARSLPAPAKQLLLGQTFPFEKSQPSSSSVDPTSVRLAQPATKKPVDPFSDEALKALLDKNCRAVFASPEEMATRRNPFGDEADMAEAREDWFAFVAKHPANLLGINTHEYVPKRRDEVAQDREWDRIEEMRKDLAEMDTGHPGWVDLSKVRWLGGEQESANTGDETKDDDDDAGSVDSREDERRDSALALSGGIEIDEYDSSTDDEEAHKRLRLGSPSSPAPARAL
ncbi:unnamed protein product [Jaminaea pallidilutea]